MSGETILVVDDEPKIVKTARAYLENAGFRVVTAEDGQMALTVYRHEKPALVILDLGLPGMDGLDVARSLRRESDVPIIMLTARVDETDKLIGLEPPRVGGPRARRSAPHRRRARASPAAHRLRRYPHRPGAAPGNG
jgi:CheY-like chemotaxis protein